MLQARLRRVLSLTFALTCGGVGAAEPAHPEHPIYATTLDQLTTEALAEVNTTAEGIKSWVEKVRPADGSRGRFRWSVDATHPANFPSTAYVLESLEYIGMFDEVITAEDRRQGIEWIYSTRTPDGSYRDSSIPLDLTKKAQWILGRYGVDERQEPQLPFPKPFPQLDEAEAISVDWVKAQYEEFSPWGAGSRVSRHLRWLLTWYLDGKISIDPLVESLRFVYSIQDPTTGQFSNKDSIQDRINGTMKMFGFTQNKLEMPIPYAERMIDTVLDQRMLRADYGRNGADGCNELDNWMVLAEAARQTNGFRDEEIKKLAAYRIVQILRHHKKPDGGISSSSSTCQRLWNDVEMAPAKAQGDALGLATLTRSVSVCIQLLGVEGQTSWTGQRGWDRTDPPAPVEVQRKIAALVFPSGVPEEAQALNVPWPSTRGPAAPQVFGRAKRSSLQEKWICSLEFKLRLARPQSGAPVRRLKLSQARHRQKQINFGIRQRTLPFSTPESVSCN